MTVKWQNFFVIIALITIILKKVVQGSNVVTMAKNYSNNFSFGSYGINIGSIVSGAILRNEFSCKKKSERTIKFSQYQLIYEVGSIQLPDSINLRNDLRGMVKKNILDEIDKCDSKSKALEIINGFGAAYIQTAKFGGSVKMSSKSSSESFSSENDLSNSLRTEASILETSGISTDARLQNGRYTGRNNTNLEFNITVKGGNPAIIFEEGIQMKNWTITNFRLAPISNLAIKESDAEKLLLGAIKTKRDKELKSFELITMNGNFSLKRMNMDLSYLSVNTTWDWYRTFNKNLFSSNKATSNYNRINQSKSEQEWILITFVMMLMETPLLVLRTLVKFVEKLSISMWTLMRQLMEAR